MYIVKNAQTREEQRCLVYPVGRRLQASESFFYFYFFKWGPVVHICVFALMLLCLLGVLDPLLKALQHLQKIPFCFSLPRVLRATADSEPAEDLRCSWLFSTLLSGTALWYHRLSWAGQPAGADYLRVPVPKTGRSTISNPLKICCWPPFLTN